MASEDMKVVTGKVRLGYPHLFKAKAQEEGGDPKYGVEILIPKSDTKTVAKIRAAQNAAAQSEKGRKLLGDAVPTFGSEKFPHKKFTDTLRDGDDEDENDGRPEREGHWFMNVRSSEQYKPGVVDKNREPIVDHTSVYGGVYGRVSIAAFAFETKGNKGVSFGLNNVLILGYGEPFGAPREEAEAAFDDDFEDDEAPDDDMI
jgi:ssDNA-binding protein